MTAAVVLAAGAGRRLGTVAKALLDLGGRSYLQTIRDTGLGAGVERFVVVVGPPHGTAVQAEASRLGLDVVVNPHPDRGMASSVAVGFAHALASFAGHDDAALLWPVDHPHVGQATVEALIASAHTACVVIPVFGGRGGHPTVFGRDTWPALAVCDLAPQGARTVIHTLEAAPGQARSRVLRLEVRDPGVIADIDTPADLADSARRSRV